MPRSLVPTGLVPLATAPVAPYAGMTYFDTALAVVRTWDAVGAAWVSGGTGSSTPEIVYSATAPANPTTGLVWIESDVDITAGGSVALVSTSAPADLTALWFDSNTGVNYLKRWNGAAWVGSVGPTGAVGPTGPTGPAGPTVATEVEIDFGTAPCWDATFTVTDAAVTGSSKILVFPSGNTATDRVGNDLAWDNILLGAVAGAGQFVVTAIAVPGPIVGKRKIYYQAI